MQKTPLIAHVIHRLDFGGLENGLVNLINRMPGESYRHAIICLTNYTDFRDRIHNPNVEVFALYKRQGNDYRLYIKLWRLFRQIRPDIVHTRNLATLEAQLPALLAGVPHRVHGEHGRDGHDLANNSAKYRLLRKVFRPLVDRYIPLSLDLHEYLREKIKVPERKLVRICNGVDIEKFTPDSSHSGQALPDGFSGKGTIVVGTVGRMEAVKDQLTLANAFIQLVKEYPNGRKCLRLVMIGDGKLRAPAQALLEAADMANIAWLPGKRDDIPLLLRAMDVFVLPSLGEGISNTILEAMASGLPIVATDVGGNRELVDQGNTGFLIPSGNKEIMAHSIRTYVDDPDLRCKHGTLARQRCEARFSIGKMVQRYQSLYDEMIYSVAK